MLREIGATAPGEPVDEPHDVRAVLGVSDQLSADQLSDRPRPDDDSVLFIGVAVLERFAHE
jgi:hypothetical protein